ncbi:hypothetical protein PHLGIDRAFT_126267 [Phlebiopsis gigantea 11061_1 CR5-6]|uniref:Uncharacterized protein n=1 Tax=Phlebiopsis gigantea (strain 11061_1 CR5-6) TaxID=745531 RepID=A0A0C3NVU4_PHLG1|nr:hypothetical protein PHLGIDRAFT_126267 [Phlebiopsis gigantea 11061_1 CR5-6]
MLALSEMENMFVHDDDEGDIDVAQDNANQSMMGFLAGQAKAFNPQNTAHQQLAVHNAVEAVGSSKAEYGKRLAAAEQLADDDDKCLDLFTKQNADMPDGSPPLEVIDAHTVLCPIDKHDTVDILELPIDELRLQFVQRILVPVQKEKATRDQYVLDGNQWICQKCKKFTHRHPSPAQPLQDISQLTTHMSLHTVWYDLELDMVVGPGVKSYFKCPSDNCKYTASSVAKIQVHCMDNCVDTAVWREIKAEHDRRYSNYHYHYPNQGKNEAGSDRTDNGAGVVPDGTRPQLRQFKQEIDEGDKHKIQQSLAELAENYDPAVATRQILEKLGISPKDLDFDLEGTLAALQQISQSYLTPDAPGASIVEGVPMVPVSRKERERYERRGYK